MMTDPCSPMFSIKHTREIARGSKIGGLGNRLKKGSFGMPLKWIGSNWVDLTHFL